MAEGPNPGQSLVKCEFSTRLDLPLIHTYVHGQNIFNTSIMHTACMYI